MSQAQQPKTIPSVFLGKTGLKVSSLCLGAMTFSTTGKGGWGLPVASQEVSHQILDKYVELGGNFIDTADAYAESEECIGNWIASKPNPVAFRDGLVIATKVRSQMGPGPNDVGLSRKHILQGIEQSLKKLRTTYIDLYQVHLWDSATPLKESLSTLHSLVQTGKVRYIGVSNFTASQIVEAQYLCKENNWEPFICLQPQYNLLCRQTEWELLPVANQFGMGIIPWSPLAGGILSGKYKRGAKDAGSGSRVEWAEKVGWGATSLSAKQEETTWKVIDEIHAIAKEIPNATPAQVSLRWLIQKGTIPIIGARTVAQVIDNIATINFTLSDEQIKRLDAASDIPKPYPYGMVSAMGTRT